MVTFAPGVLYQCCLEFHDLQLIQLEFCKIMAVDQFKFEITKQIKFGQKSHADRKGSKKTIQITVHVNTPITKVVPNIIFYKFGI